MCITKSIIELKNIWNFIKKRTLEKNIWWLGGMAPWPPLDPPLGLVYVMPRYSSIVEIGGTSETVE